MDLLRREVPASSLVVAIDPGKAFNRVWMTSGERGLIGEPVSLPVLREGIDELERLIASSGVGPLLPGHAVSMQRSVRVSPVAGVPSAPTARARRARGR